MKTRYIILIGFIVGIISNILGIKIFSLEWFVFVLGLNFLCIIVIPDFINYFKEKNKP
jgi:hypothetical protein